MTNEVPRAPRQRPRAWLTPTELESTVNNVTAFPETETPTDAEPASPCFEDKIIDIMTLPGLDPLHGLLKTARGELHVAICALDVERQAHDDFDPGGHLYDQFERVARILDLVHDEIRARALDNMRKTEGGVA